MGKNKTPPVTRRHGRVHLLYEPHLEELIRLIQDEEQHRAQVALLLFDERFQPKRRRHQDVHLIHLVVLRRLGQQTRPGERVGIRWRNM